MNAIQSMNYVYFMMAALLQKLGLSSSLSYRK